MKFDFKRSIEESSSKCGFHCEVFGLSQNHSVALDKQSVSGTKKAGASKGKKRRCQKKVFLRSVKSVQITQGFVSGV